jgi:hypothetical protein
MPSFVEKFGNGFVGLINFPKNSAFGFVTGHNIKLDERLLVDREGPKNEAGSVSTISGGAELPPEDACAAVRLLLAVIGSAP